MENSVWNYINMKRAKKMFVPRNGLKPVCFDQILIKLWKLVKNNYIEL